MSSFGSFCTPVSFAFAAQEEEESEGEDGNNDDMRDLFDEPEIEEHLRSLDNEQQCAAASERQEMTVTSEVHAMAEVHTYIDEVKIILFFRNRLYMKLKSANIDLHQL